MESLAKYLNQQGFRCHALDRKVKVELGSFGQFVYIVKDYQRGCYIVQSHVTIQLISFVLMLGVGLYGLAAQGSALSAVIAAISLGGLINLILIEVKTLPLKRNLQQLSNISLEEVENSH
ncbi:hypothetical protein Vca1114GL_03429 [Vibrio campbellii]|uniref:hypothetical protein n=1 Tax=Vibrio campbellii TaxID=680 RepID=UPI00097FBE14|nr:hypothetical protein [Vibrio campbellii]AQM69855.1 hypothetical protein Vca1114GL_03429 [Vibrio campbellii]